MAKCRMCNESGWFLSTNEKGLCEQCETTWQIEVPRRIQIIEQSLEIATNTKNLNTLLSRFNVALSACYELGGYEHRSIPTTEPSPNILAKNIRLKREKMILIWIRRELDQARRKSKAATTPTSKTRPYGKLLESIGIVYEELGNDVSAVGNEEAQVRKEMDATRISIEIERAQKLAFKGDNKRALAAYLDALFLLHSDSTPDDQQQEEIAKIHTAIKELGGEIPQPPK